MLPRFGFIFLRVLQPLLAIVFGHDMGSNALQCLLLGPRRRGLGVRIHPEQRRLARSVGRFARLPDFGGGIALQSCGVRGGGQLG